MGGVPFHNIVKDIDFSWSFDNDKTSSKIGDIISSQVFLSDSGES